MNIVMNIVMPALTSRAPLFAVAAALLTGTACNLQAQSSAAQSSAPTTIRESVAPSVNVARVPENGLQPQIVARDGVLHLLYFSGDAAHGDVFYVRSQDDAKSWSAPLRVNSQAGSVVAMGTIRGAQLSVGRDGRALVAWNGSDAATPRNPLTPAAERKHGAAPLLFARLNDAGDKFEPQRNLMTRTFNLDGGASVAADAQGRVYVAWHANTKAGQDEGERQVFLSASSDDGKTFSPERAVWNTPTGACSCCQLRLMAEGNRVSLLYRSAKNLVHRDTYYLASNDGGRTFRGTNVQKWQIGACPMSSFSLAKRGAQTLGAWESRERVHFGALATTTPTTAATAGRITDVPLGDNQKYPTLAVNTRGQTLLAWTEGTSWARGGKLRWQVYDADGAPIPTASGERDGVPAWSFPAAFTRPDGNFELLY